MKLFHCGFLSTRKEEEIPIGFDYDEGSRIEGASPMAHARRLRNAPYAGLSNARSDAFQPRQSQVRDCPYPIHNGSSTVQERLSVLGQGGGMRR
jgi:hypothetical protein